MLKTLLFREIRYNDKVEHDLENYKNRIAENSEDVIALKNAALIYHALKKNEKAVNMYEKLVELKPNDHEAIAFLGYLYYESDNLAKAKENFQRSLDINPMEPFVLFLLGNTYAREGDIMKAVDNYDFAIFLDLDIYTAHVDFGRKYEHMGRHEKALQEYKAAYDIHPADDGLKEKIKYLEDKCGK